MKNSHIEKYLGLTEFRKKENFSTKQKMTQSKSKKIQSYKTFDDSIDVKDYRRDNLKAFAASINKFLSDNEIDSIEKIEKYSSMKKDDLYEKIKDFVEESGNLEKSMVQKATDALTLIDAEFKKLAAPRKSSSRASKLSKVALGKLKNEIEKGANIESYTIKDLKQLLASEKYSGSSSLTGKNVYEAVKKLKDVNWSAKVANRKEFDFDDFEDLEIADIEKKYSGNDLKTASDKYGLPKSVFISGKSKGVTKQHIITMLEHYKDFSDDEKLILQPNKIVFYPKLPFDIALSDLDFGVDVVGKSKKRRNTYNKDQLVEFAKMASIATGGMKADNLFKALQKYGKQLTIVEPDVGAVLHKYRYYFIDESGFPKKEIKHTVTVDVKGKKRTSERNIPVKSKDENALTLRKIAGELGIKKYSSLNKKALVDKIQRLYKNEYKQEEESALVKIKRLMSTLDVEEYKLLADAFKSKETQKQVLQTLKKADKPKKSKTSQKKKKSPKKVKTPEKILSSEPIEEFELTKKEKGMLLYKSKCMKESVSNIKKLGEKLDIKITGRKKSNVCNSLMLGYFEYQLGQKVGKKTARAIMVEEDEKALQKLIDANEDNVGEVLGEYFEVESDEYATTIMNLAAELDDTESATEDITPSPTPVPLTKDEKEFFEGETEEEGEDLDYDPEKEGEDTEEDTEEEESENLEKDEAEEAVKAIDDIFG